MPLYSLLGHIVSDRVAIRCSIDHSKNIDWQREAQVKKLGRSMRKQYEYAVKTNKDVSQNLVFKAQVNCTLISSSQLTDARFPGLEQFSDG